MPEFQRMPKMSTYWTDKLNETYPRQECEVDLLLGVTTSLQLIRGKLIKVSTSLYLLPTPWGYVPAGHYDVVTSASYLSNTQRVAELLEKQWHIQELPFDNSSDVLSKDELEAVKKVDEVLHYIPSEKRFQASLLQFLQITL